MTDLGDFDDFESDWEKVDRKRGVLTKQDREYLLNKLELDGQRERDTKFRIRERIRNAVYDINILSDSYPSGEYEKVINSSAIYPGMVGNMVEFGFKLLVAQVGITKAVNTFEALVQMAISPVIIDNLEDEDEIPVSISVNIDVEKTEFDEDQVLNRILDGEGTLEDIRNYAIGGDSERLKQELKKGLGSVTVRHEEMNTEFKLHPENVEDIIYYSIENV